MSSSLPRVRRFDYLITFLRSVEQGLGQEQMLEKLADRKRDFEIEKNKALGRGKPFSKTIKTSKSLLDDCRKLAEVCRLIDYDQCRLSSLGKGVVESSTESGRALLGKALLEGFPSFANVTLQLSRLPDWEITVPLERNNRLFSNCISKYGLRSGQMDFEIIRDWLTQLGVSNWLVVEDKGSRLTKVYLCSTIREVAADGDNIVFISSGTKYSVKFNSVESSNLKHVLWEEYLKAAGFVPRKPVFYSEIRAIVCYKLRISDDLFDREVTKLIEHDDQYLIAGSGGLLPRTRDPASMLKYLPPKDEWGDYIVYLRLDKR